MFERFLTSYTLCSYQPYTRVDEAQGEKHAPSLSPRRLIQKKVIRNLSYTDRRGKGRCKKLHANRQNKQISTRRRPAVYLFFSVCFHSSAAYFHRFPYSLSRPLPRKPGASGHFSKSRAHAYPTPLVSLFPALGDITPPRPRSTNQAEPPAGSAPRTLDVSPRPYRLSQPRPSLCLCSLRLFPSQARARATR